VTLTVDGHRSRSDQYGRFLIAGLAAGHHELEIDGSTASTRRRSFGCFETGIDLVDGQTLVLPYTICMTRLDLKHAVSIPSPTTQPTTVTTPEIPGFEVRLPAGSTVTDHNGQTVASLSITAI